VNPGNNPSKVRVSFLPSFCVSTSTLGAVFVKQERAESTNSLRFENSFVLELMLWVVPLCYASCVACRGAWSVEVEYTTGITGSRS